MLTSLRDWITDRNSQILAIGGSPATAFPSPVALISKCYANSARQAEVPVISHFCSLPATAASGMSLQEQGLLSLVYSLIRQLIDCLPPIVDCAVSCELSAERLTALSGNLTSWKEVLSLIDILLHFAPPLLICVIDGIDVLQDPSTNVHIRSLVRVFLMHTRHYAVPMPDGRTQRVLLKVLFTVAGRPNPLVETLSESQSTVSESNRSEPPTASLPADAGAVLMNA